MIRNRLLPALVTSLVATASLAIVPPNTQEPLRQKAFRHPDLDYRNVVRPLATLPAALSRRLAPELASLGVDPGNAYVDPRTGRWGTLIVTEPLVPGAGIGNEAAWSALGVEAPRDAEERKQAAWKAFRRYLVRHAAQLQIDPLELAVPRVSLHGERLIQIHVGRQHDGVPVRGAFVKAAINSGNLVLLGLRNWGTLELETRPAITHIQAEGSLRRHLEHFAAADFRKAPRLEILPVSNQSEDAMVPGEGLHYRLVWVLTPTFEGGHGTWEALVDAHSGELLAFQDTNLYASRRVGGGVYPVSNDGMPPDGVEQPGYPMPFTDIALDGEPLGFASAGGNLPPGADTGTISTTLSGLYVEMADQCGAVDESAASGDLDLGDGPGTNCEVPPGHSAGDTHASRSGYYELNRLIEQARGYLLGNGWLDRQLTANMNINDFCNAFWDGVTVNFFRDAPAFGCANTGEIAAIFDHEWGHGLDSNDADGAISSPGESIADIVAQNRLNESCVGRGFFLSGVCGGYGDPCTECTGVRESDWERRQSGAPHGIDWILSNFSDEDGGCVGLGGDQFGPCGQETHCEGTIVAEAVWDLVHRDLQGYEGSPFDLDTNTALELGTRLTYSGAANVGNWYQCATDGTGGCNADGGYLGYLAADDDNGDLTDGTPHMSAIFAAFDRHQLACPTPAVQDSGCAGGPATAPDNVMTVPLHEGAQLTWDPVPGAGEYWIFRTEGVHGCDFGKAKVGETSSTDFVELGLRNGFETFYSIVPVGENGACTGPMSACLPVTPVPGPGLGFLSTPLAWNEQGGDGDAFLDNCETGALTFQVSNTGVGSLTDLRIVEATSSSHPGAFILTELPSTIVASLAEGATATGELQIQGGGFTFDDTLELEVTVTSDELEPLTFTRTYTLEGLESDLELRAGVTYSFEEGADAWRLVSGVFDRTDAGGGADGTTFYRASSSGLHLQCDRVQSPLIRLTETSTLELSNQFDIEAQSGGSWWDRANVGIFDPATGERTVVSPDGGRVYNVSGTGNGPAPCVSHASPDLPGWAGSGPDWQASSWSADALGSPELGGRLIRLDIAYGTDPLVTGAFGFWFDEVTVTDAIVQIPDGQSNVCADFAPTALTVDVEDNGVFEPGESVVVAPAWQNVSTLFASLAGTGESYTGPGPGALYTLVDYSADYGVLDPGAEASCAATGDCYRLSVFNPSTRPVQHWDAAFDEVTVAGTQQSWTLHLGESFIDVTRSSLFYRPIETLLHHGVTAGCGGTEYCPDGGNTRGQMAVFLLRAAEGGDYLPPPCMEGEEPFADVPVDSPFCPWIQELSSRGVTTGCGDGNYCPGDAVTRAQMAAFLLKALEGTGYTPPACAHEFSDVPCPSTFANWIEELAERGITGGCATDPPAYCPATPVTRGQMAAFVIKALGLTLYGP